MGARGRIDGRQREGGGGASKGDRGEADSVGEVDYQGDAGVEQRRGE